MIIVKFLSPATSFPRLHLKIHRNPLNFDPGTVDEDDIELLKLLPILEAIADAPNVLQAKPLYHPGEYGFS